MQDLRQSFTQISSAEWMEILILLGVAAIIGLIIGWLLRSFKVKSLRRLLGEKTDAYNALDKTHQQKLGLISEMEAENGEMVNRVTTLNDEIKSLKLKLTNSQSAGILSDDDAKALVVTDENEEGLAENDNEQGKTGWLQRVRNVFASNPIVVSDEDNEISFQEKIDASNNMIERLLSSNEKLEDENEELNKKILGLEEIATNNNNNTTVEAVATKPTVIKKEIDAEKIDKYTNSLKDAKLTSQELLKRIEELEIYNGKIIKQLEQQTEEKASTQKKLTENGDYKTKYLELAPKFETVEIDNTKLKAEMGQLKSTTQTDILKNDLKQKEENLALLKKEKQALTEKLQNAAKALAACNDEQVTLKTKLEGAINKSKISQTPPKVAAMPLPTKAPVTTKIEETKPVLETSHDIMARIKNKANSIDFNRIGIGSAGGKDDLKRVKGIGEFVEKKLNALGIYHFKQLAKLTEDDMDKVNDAIEFFPGRIKRDKWVEQAIKLAAE